MNSRRAARTIAFVLYVVLSVLFLAPGASLRTGLTGSGIEQESVVWMLDWWPWSIRHGLDPLTSDMVWNGLGYNMTWSAAMPTLGLLLAPVTWVAGPVLTANLVTILAPATAAWAAFLLLQAITRATLPAFLGGLIFGFSPYEMAQSLGHPNLTVIALVPAVLLLCKVRLDGAMGRWRFILLLALAALLQLGLSTELLLTSALAGALAWVVFVATSKARKPYLVLAGEVAVAGLLAILVASPFLISLVGGLGVVPPKLNDPDVFSADILNFIVPTQVNWFGGRLFASVSALFTGNIGEQDAYIGLPLLLVVCISVVAASWRDLMTTRCVILFSLFALFSLGGLLHAGRSVAAFSLPWSALTSLPITGSILPVRIAMFTSLAVAVICTRFLAARPTLPRYAAIVAGLLFLLPSRSARPTQVWSVDPFFTPANIARHFGADPVLVVLPFGYNGHAMAWQIDAGHAFRMTGGYLGYTPKTERNTAILAAFLSNEIPPHFTAHLAMYCHDHGASAILIGPGTSRKLRDAVLATGWPTEQDGDITIVRPPAGDRETMPMISGDYWPNPADQDWMGRQIRIETAAAPVHIDLSRPGEVAAPGAVVTIDGAARHIALRNGETVRLDLPPHAVTVIRADTVFVPAQLHINADPRPLSLMLTLP